jgi:hypothetical protein
MGNNAVQTRPATEYHTMFPSLLSRLPERSTFLNASPYPHFIIDDFLPDEIALAASQSFPDVSDRHWINYIHVNEKKFGLSKREAIPPAILKIIDQLMTPEFLETLSHATGIGGLQGDDELAGGGLHQMHPGGFLNIHSDFLIHPTKKKLARRINLILFLSDDWTAECGGNLELWNKEMTACVKSIAPKFNRCVIFLTDEFSYHGCPQKLKGPLGFSRKSIALYYYTQFSKRPLKYFTDYRARPEDRKNKLAIYLDSKAVGIYSWLKQTFHLRDDFVSNILKKFK